MSRSSRPDELLALADRLEQTLKVMKAARRTPTLQMCVWADDAKAVEDSVTALRASAQHGTAAGEPVAWRFTSIHTGETWGIFDTQPSDGEVESGQWLIEPLYAALPAAPSSVAQPAPGAGLDDVREAFTKHIRLVPVDPAAYERHGDYFNETDDNLGWRVKPESIDAFLAALTSAAPASEVAGLERIAHNLIEAKKLFYKIDGDYSDPGDWCDEGAKLLADAQTDLDAILAAIGRGTGADTTCNTCDGTGEFQGGRRTLQKPICQKCKGTGIKPGPSDPSAPPATVAEAVTEDDDIDHYLGQLEDRERE